MSRRRAFEGDEATLSYHQKRPCSGLIAHDRYTVAWICALPIEMAAARAMLDQEHRSDIKDSLRHGLRNDPLLRGDSRNEPLVGDHPLPINEHEHLSRVDDGNSYVLGTIQGQNVVLACLPIEEYGTNNAAIVMSNLKRTFTKISICLMVGIGGGVPTKADIRLGDIVVGTRVMQSDLGKTVDGKLQRTALPRIPGSNIRTVISNLRSRHELEGSHVAMILKNKMQKYPAFGLPNEPDRLFKSSYSHPVDASTCEECDESRIEKRKNRSSTDPFIHYGGIASGNQVMKDATSRDNIATELDIICFEMEAAGIMNVEPCLPIRGICDYSDSHKAKEWQRYAAATAAAYAYELLEVRGQHTRDVESVHILSTVENKPPASTERHDQLLESLNFEAIDARKTNIRAAHSKTCHWFLKHQDYLAWKDPAKLSEHHGFLWIRGKPGAGKSTIMKYIYLQTRKKDKNNQVLTASFFFNARGEALEKTISGMYRSLLLQLFNGFPDLQCVLDDSDLLPQSQTTCPSLNSLKDLLRSAVLKLDQRSFTCFIDALDECDEQQVMDLVCFFEDVAETCTENGVRFRICFSSRHYPYIDINRGMRLTVEDQEGHASDLESYIKSNLRIKDPALVAQLQERMLVKASGVFLWVVLVVDVLNDENRRGRLNLRNRLERVPSGLSELFKDILRRDKANAEELLLCLLWILLSKRPLRPDEYYHALWSGLSLEGLADPEVLSVDTTDAAQCFDKSVVSSSKGLAEITKAKQPTVQFIHESVRDFLIKDKGLAEIWPELQADWEGFGHNKLKRCCDFYFRLQVSPKDEINENRPSESPFLNVEKKYPFGEYACQFVLYHADCAAETYCQQEFMCDFPVRHWIHAFNGFEKRKVRRYTPEAELLYILADRGYSSLIRTRLKADPRIDLAFERERYVYPLIAAMAQGHKNSIVALLGLTSPIHEGVDITKSIVPNISSGAKRRTPFSWACDHGYLGIAKLLVQKGVSRNAEDGFTPLMYAIKRGHIDLVESLLDIGGDIRASVKDSSIISLAIETGNTDIVKVLLDWGIEPDSTTSTGMPILSFASSRGYEAIVMEILDKGGDVDIVDFLARRPVHLATSKTVLEALFDKGADMNVRNNDGETCFWNAIKHLELDAWSFLIEHGVDINARNNDGQTCLVQAVHSGKIGAIDFLCNNGANVNAQDNNANTCLHHVPFDQKHDAVVQNLFKHGANPNMTNLGSETFLHRCARWGHIAKLIDHDWFQDYHRYKVDTKSHDSPGNTPLHFAANESKDEQLHLRLRHGADINLRNSQGKTPLDLAREWDHKDITHYLISIGAESGYEISSRPNQFSEPQDKDHGGEVRRYLML